MDMYENMHMYVYMARELNLLRTVGHEQVMLILIGKHEMCDVLLHCCTVLIIFHVSLVKIGRASCRERV